MAGHQWGPVCLLWSCVLRKRGAASTSTCEFTGPYVSAHLPNGLCPQGHDILGLRCPGTQLEVGSAYLFLSLMWGGHGWVEGVVRFCGASSGPSVQSGSLLDLRRMLGVLTEVCDLDLPCNLCTHLRERSLRRSLVRALP